MTMVPLLLALVALASQSPRTAATAASSNGDCTATVSKLWRHSNITVNDVDDACCTTMKDALKKPLLTKLPACLVGKKVTSVQWADGHACSGDDRCDLSSIIPRQYFDTISNDWYGMSAECCTFYHKLQPPLPENCPPFRHFCARFVGYFENFTASAIWGHDALAQLALAGDQEQTGETVVVV